MNKKLKIAIIIALIFIIIIGVYGLYLSLTTEHYTIYVGLNDKDQNKQIISTSDAIETVDGIFINNSVDFTDLIQKESLNLMVQNIMKIH